MFNWLCIFREDIALMFCCCIDILVILSSDGGATSGQLDHHVLDYLFYLVPYNLSIVNGTAFLETLSLAVVWNKHKMIGHTMHQHGLQ